MDYTVSSSIQKPSQAQQDSKDLKGAIVGLLIVGLLVFGVIQYEVFLRDVSAVPLRTLVAQARRAVFLARQDPNPNREPERVRADRLMSNPAYPKTPTLDRVPEGYIVRVPAADHAACASRLAEAEHDKDYEVLTVNDIKVVAGTDPCAPSGPSALTVLAVR